MNNDRKLDSSSTSKNLLVTCALMIVTFATRALFIYKNGMGDADSVVMAAGMASGMSSDTSFGDTLLYGRQINPGIYFVTYVLYPLIIDTPSHIMGFLNWFGVISFTLLVWPLYAIFRKHLTAAAAAGSILLFVFSPLVWESGTYFHPLVPACPLLLLSVLTWQRIEYSPKGVFFVILTYLTAAAAFLIRVEILIVVPALFAWTLCSQRKRRNTLMLAGLVILVVVTYLAMLRLIYSTTTVEHHGLRQYFSSLYQMYVRNFSLPGMTRSPVWMALSVGIGTIVLAVYGLLGRFLPARTRSGSGRGVDGSLKIVALVWILPSLIFWLPQPIPIMRHYFLATIGFSWLAGSTVLARSSLRSVCFIVLAAVACNILVPEIAYRSYNAARPASAKAPHGAFFYYHQKMADRIDRYRRLQSEILQPAEQPGADETQGPRPGALVHVDWEGYAYVLYGLVTSSYDLKKLSITTEHPQMYMHRYNLGGSEIRIVHSFRLGNEAAGRRLAQIITQAASEGLHVYVLAENLQSVLEYTDSDVEIVPY